MEQNKFFYYILMQNYIYIQGHVVKHITEDFIFEKKDQLLQHNHTPNHSLQQHMITNLKIF